MKTGRNDHRRPLAALLLVGLLACAGCGSSGGGGGGGEGGVCKPPERKAAPAGTPFAIGGEYEVTVGVTIDDCIGIDHEEIVTPMQIQEMTETVAEVDLPVGGAGGECNRVEYARDVNTLERFESKLIDITPTCTVEHCVTTVLDFFDDGTVVGSEVNEFAPRDPMACMGDFSLCTIEVAIDGARCTDCFECRPLGGP